ncbi:MAG: hypothetical protein SOY06_08855 [Prevotella sp.]|nr:hypothetical protein [Bacteroidales bacterium]MDY4229933.1 hypothetical protein [Prevotella sp.]
MTCFTCKNHSRVPMRSPGGEGYIFNELAMLVDGVPVARSTAVAVVVEPLCF